MYGSAGSGRKRDRGDSRRYSPTAASSQPDRASVGIRCDPQVCFGAPQHHFRDIHDAHETGSFILIERDAAILIQRGALH